MRESNLPKAAENRKTAIRKATKFSENPFLKGSITEVKGKKKFYNVIGKNDLITDATTGDVTGGVEHKVVRIVDDALFVKIFGDGISGIYDLKSPGKKVFKFLLDVVQKNPNVDRIYLHFMDAAEEPYTMSPSVFFRGMTELISKNFVAASDRQHMYYLNPMMVWNGDRFKFVQEYVRGNRAKESDTLADQSAAPDKRKLEVPRDPNTVDLINGKTDAETKAAS